jgi:excinuclease ABC subunit A
MLTPDEDDERSDEVADALRTFDPADVTAHGKPCPTCHGERISRIARAVRLPLQGNRKSRIENRKSSISLPELTHLTPDDLLATLRNLQLEARGKLITQDIVPQIEERLRFLGQVGLDYLCNSTAPPRPCPAARPSASASRPSSARTFPACSTCSTNRPSACTPATTTG